MISVFIAFLISTIITFGIASISFSDFWFRVSNGLVDKLDNAVYAAFVAGLHLIDGVLHPIGIQIPFDFIRDVEFYLPFLSNSAGYDSLVPKQPQLILVMVITSLMTSIWLWLFVVAFYLQKIGFATPYLHEYLVRWTNAEENPYKFLIVIALCLWTASFITIKLVSG